MGKEIEKYDPLDPRELAMRAGAEVARRMSAGEGELVVPDQDRPPVDPSFKQTQSRREKRQRRTMHVVNDEEYILTEETTVTETHSFGDDFLSGQPKMKAPRRRRPSRDED